MRKSTLYAMTAAVVMTGFFTGCSGKPASAGSAAATTAATTAAASAAESQAAGKETEAVKAEQKEVTGLELKRDIYERKYPQQNVEKVMYCASAVLPEVTTEGYEALNRTLADLNEAAILEVDEEFRARAEDFLEFEVQEYQWEMMPFSDSHFLTFDRTDSVLLSYVHTYDSWYGGAHPDSLQFGCTFDPQSGKRLSLADMVTDYSAFCDALRAEFGAGESAEYYFEDWEATFNEMAAKDGDEGIQWSAAADGLDIWFNYYDLGPRAIGPVSVEVKLNDGKLGSFLRKEYFPEKVPEVFSFPTNETAVEVTDLCDIEENYTDSCDNEYEMHFRMPHFDGGTKDIEEANKQIDKLYHDMVEPAVEGMKTGDSPVLIGFDYSVVTYRGITSVYAWTETDYDWVDHYSFNFRADGTKAENKDLFALYDLTEEEFTTAAKAVVDEEAAVDPEMVTEEQKKELDQMRKTSVDRVSAQNAVYIDCDNALCFIAGIDVPAGGGYYESGYRIPGTIRRTDRREEVRIIPMEMDNYRKDGNAWYIKDRFSDRAYRFDEDTILVYDLPCIDACESKKAMDWIEVYLDAEMNVGYGPGDVWLLLIGDDAHIDAVEGIYWWD